MTRWWDRTDDYIILWLPLTQPPPIHLTIPQRQLDREAIARSSNTLEKLVFWLCVLDNKTTLYM